MPDKLLELKNDLVFQELFGNPKNSQITAHLLSLILKRKVYNVDLDTNKRMLRNRPDLKVGRLDIRVKFNDGEECNIELQVKQYSNMEIRMLEYWAMMYGNKIPRGEKNTQIKPTISILITNYDVDKTRDIEQYHTVWNLREQEYQNITLTNEIEIHILEIPKIKNTELENDELAQWLKFIENPESKEVEIFMRENKYLKQAREELAYLSGDEEFQYMVDTRALDLMYEDREREIIKDKAITEGRVEGITEGETSKAKQIAKKMKAKNIPIEEIIELTGLTKEEVESL